LSYVGYSHVHEERTQGEVRSEIPGGPFQGDSTLGWLVWHQMSDALRDANMYSIGFVQVILQELILIIKIRCEGKAKAVAPFRFKANQKQ
jgi:hypothetical protein